MLENKWYDIVKQAISAPNGAEMKTIQNTLWSSGVYEMRTSPLRTACTVILEEQTTELPASVSWLLKRVREAGFPPAYPNYLGMDALAICDPARMSSPQLAKATFHLIYDLLHQLLEVPQLADHPQRARLDKGVHRILEKCGEYAFSKTPVAALPHYAIEISLTPESNVSDELIFLRVLQTTDSIFFSTSALADTANEMIEYDNLVEAVVALHWLACLASLLMPLLRPLFCMSIDNWWLIRPRIEKPSAIQSTYFHKMCGQLNQIRRILDHTHTSEIQQRYIPVCSELLDDAYGSIQSWYNAHTRIAGKYGRATPTNKPKGVAWLEKQIPLPEFANSPNSVKALAAKQKMSD